MALRFGLDNFNRKRGSSPLFILTEHKTVFLTDIFIINYFFPVSSVCLWENLYKFLLISPNLPIALVVYSLIFYKNVIDEIKFMISLL